MDSWSLCDFLLRRPRLGCGPDLNGVRKPVFGRATRPEQLNCFMLLTTWPMLVHEQLCASRILLGLGREPHRLLAGMRP